MIAVILKDGNDECWLFGLFWLRYLTLEFSGPADQLRINEFKVSGRCAMLDKPVRWLVQSTRYRLVEGSLNSPLLSDSVNPMLGETHGK